MRATVPITVVTAIVANKLSCRILKPEVRQTNANVYESSERTNLVCMMIYEKEFM